MDIPRTIFNIAKINDMHFKLLFSFDTLYPVNAFIPYFICDI